MIWSEKQRSRPRQSTLSYQAVEPRRLLACTTADFCGTELDDHIEIAVTEETLELSINGVQESLQASDMPDVVISGLEGDDYITISGPDGVPENRYLDDLLFIDGKAVSPFVQLSLNRLARLHFAVE